MFKYFRPSLTPSQLTERGTDIEFQGRFHDTLSYHHFTEHDYNTLHKVRDILAPSLSEAVDLFERYLTELKKEDQPAISRSYIESYFQIFFEEHRDQAYVDKMLPFFNELRARGYNIGKLVVVFNQLNFFFLIFLLSKKALAPATCLSLMESLQRAINIDLQLLVEVYTEKIMEQVAEGIAHLMDKNAEIMYIKDLIEKLDEQNEDVQNVTAASEEMTASIVEVADNATAVAEKTENAVSKTAEGKTLITEALEDIVKTEQVFSNITSKFSNLQQHIQSIAKVVKLIEEIAGQTNLLALNASIEAARAGEHGRGFAVVADEVRKLAESTVKSLHQINESVTNLNKFSQEVESSIQMTSVEIKKDVADARRSLPVLEQILQEVHQINDATSSTAAIAQEQAAAIDEIAHRMVSISHLTEEVKLLGESTGKTVHELSKITESFRTDVFTNNIALSTNALLQLAKTDHILWKWRIYNMLLGLEKISSENVSSHQVCRLGKWYFDPMTEQRLHGYDSYQKLDAPHKKVHDEARLAAEAYNRGDRQQAEMHLSRLTEASNEVLALIDDLLHKLERDKKKIGQ